MTFQVDHGALATPTLMYIGAIWHTSALAKLMMIVCYKSHTFLPLMSMHHVSTAAKMAEGSLNCHWKYAKSMADPGGGSTKASLQNAGWHQGVTSI